MRSKRKEECWLVGEGPIFITLWTLLKEISINETSKRKEEYWPVGEGGVEVQLSYIGNQIWECTKFTLFLVILAKLLNYLTIHCI